MSNLSRWTLSKARAIARGKRISDVHRLVVLYGGRGSTWSTPAFEIRGEYFKYHWYEHPGIGRVELKRKRVDGR